MSTISVTVWAGDGAIRLARDAVPTVRLWQLLHIIGSIDFGEALGADNV